jgi:non-ribosomal peptide synthetase component F
MSPTAGHPVISNIQSPPDCHGVIAGLLDFAERDPNRIALIDGDGPTTHGELRDAVLGLAGRMLHDLPDGALVALLLPADADLVSAALACLATGHPYLPLDARAPSSRIAETIRRAAPSAVLVSRDTAALVSAAEPELLCMTVNDPAAAPPAGASLPDQQSLAGRIASIHYTSGSTGEPKGVIRSRPQVAAMIARLLSELGLNEHDRLMIGQNSSAAVWHETMLSVLGCGAQLSIDPFRDGLAVTLDRLRRERTTVLRCTATMLRTLTASIDTRIDTLRLVTVGSEWMFSADLVPFRERFPRHTRLLSIAGTTECGWISRWDVDPWLEYPTHVLPAGYPPSDVVISLVDPDGSSVASGDVGQLIVSSPTVSSGYWRDPGITAAGFAPMPGNPAAYSFRTGDNARLRKDGALELLGRHDRMVKVNGTLVSLPEIEGVMRGCPGVADAALVARKTSDAVTLIGYLVPAAAEAGAWLPDHVRKRISLLLPAVMRPAELHCLDALPRPERST